MCGPRFLTANAFALATVLAAGALCGGAQSPAGDVFELRVGDRTRIEGTEISLTFAEVTEDSRCPADVTCIWAGEAVVVLAVRDDGGDTADVTLRVPPDGSDTAEFEGYVICIVTLEPQARSEKDIEEREYIARVRVTVDAL